MNVSEAQQMTNELLNKKVHKDKMISATLTINGMNISTVNIPIDNPDFKFDAHELQDCFENWLGAYFGMDL